MKCTADAGFFAPVWNVAAVDPDVFAPYLTLIGSFVSSSYLVQNFYTDTLDPMGFLL